MANYYGTTVSEGGEVTDVEKVREIVAKWTRRGAEGEISIEVNNYQDTHIINIYGFDDFYLYNPDDEDDYDDNTEVFLKELCPYIKTPLIIKSVGNEKCRYVGAGAWIVTPTKVMYASLDEAIDYKLNTLPL